MQAVFKATRWIALTLLALLLCWSLSRSIMTSAPWAVQGGVTLGVLVPNILPVIAVAILVVAVYVWNPENLELGIRQWRSISAKSLLAIAGLSVVVAFAVHTLLEQGLHPVDFAVTLIIAACLVVSIFLALMGRILDGMCVYILTWPLISYAETVIPVFSRTVIAELRGPIPLTTMTVWLLLLFLIWLVHWGMEHRMLLRSSLEPGIFLFLIAGLASGLGSVDPLKSLGFYFPIAVILPMMAFTLFLNNVRSWEDVRRISCTVAISGAMIVLVAIYYGLYRHPDAGETVVSGLSSLRGDRWLVVEGAIAPGFAAHSLPLVIALVATSKRRYAKAAWIGIAALFVCAAVLSFERKEWLLIVLGMLPWLFGTWQARKWSIIAISVLILIALLFPAEIGPFFVRFGTFGSLDTFLTETRVGLWTGAVQMFLDHPWVGVGIGMWERVAPSYDVIAAAAVSRDPVTGYIMGYYSHAHSGLFNVAAEAGVVGLLAWAAMFSGFAFETFRLFRKVVAGASPYARAILGCSLVLLSDFFIGELPLSIKGVENPGFALIWLVAALLIAANGFLSSEGSQLTDRRGRESED